MKLLPLLAVVFATLTTALRSGTTRTPANAIQLSKVKTLTLRAGKQTSARRVSPIPQLKCIGGNARNLYDVDVMQCTNSGADYGDEDIQWTCKSSLPADFKLGSTEVICEGYDSPEDPFVLKGSCGVEYRLVLTEEGERKYGPEVAKGESKNARVVKNLIFWLFFIFIISVFVKGALDWYARSQGRRPPGAAGGNFGAWGGGNDDDNNDPPPPYTRRPSSKSAFAQYGSNNGQRGWNPGLWTGAAAGAAAGYGAGYMHGGRNSGRNTDPQVGSSRWGGGSGRQGGSSSPAPSTSRYESTGFGGTSRR